MKILQVRGYLDFDVEMENVGVFWSGTEALLLEYRWAILMLCHSVFFSFFLSAHLT